MPTSSRSERRSRRNFTICDLPRRRLVVANAAEDAPRVLAWGRGPRVTWFNDPAGYRTGGDDGRHSGSERRGGRDRSRRLAPTGDHNRPTWGRAALLPGT